MWNIFQNEMPNIISDANGSMYADDHLVFVAKALQRNPAAKNVKILVDNGESMTKWNQDNFLKVNCGKYQAMVLEIQKEKETLIFNPNPVNKVS